MNFITSKKTLIAVLSVAVLVMISLMLFPNLFKFGFFRQSNPVNSEVLEIKKQSNDTSMESIKKDLDNTNVDNLDKEVDSIDKEINAAI